MKKDELRTAVEKAKLEINDQIEEFLEALDKGTADPDNHLSMSEIEKKWRSLNLSTHKTYSDMMNTVLSELDTPEVNESKKDNSSKVE